MSRTVVKILEALEKTPQLAAMEALLREKTSQPVVYENLVGEAGEPGLDGRYTYDPQRGHLIQLTIGKATQYTVAHELSHALMRADALVSAGFIEQEHTEIAGRIRSTILHPAMSPYLLPFGFLPLHEAFYYKNIQLFSILREDIIQYDEKHALTVRIRALEFAETFLCRPASIKELGQQFSESAPRVWTYAIKWHNVVKNSDLRTPRGCRGATVALIKELDQHGVDSESEITKSLLDHLVVPWVYQENEAKRPALTVFQLDHKLINGSYQAFVRYLEDNSVVGRLCLEGQEEVPRLLEEWGKKTASDIIVELEGGGTARNSLGRFP